MIRLVKGEIMINKYLKYVSKGLDVFDNTVGELFVMFFCFFLGLFALPFFLIGLLTRRK